MRHLHQFDALEWLRLEPLVQGLKQLRNDALLAAYLRRVPPELASFLAASAHLRGRRLALVIAFEQTWTLDWLLESAARNLPGTTVLVFDNSRSDTARAEVAAVCERHAIGYLPLPAYRTRHANRSHGMAMSWVFHNVVRALEPELFAFLDHDLIPTEPVDLEQRLGHQPAYGLINQGRFGCWSLWAGYCAFRFGHVSALPLNFLYDFSRDLDTGGRNWPILYSRLQRERLRFAPRSVPQLRLPDGALLRCELVDDAWIHVGGVSYNDNTQRKFEAFTALRKSLASGVSWRALLAERTDPAPIAV